MSHFSSASADRCVFYRWFRRGMTYRTKLNQTNLLLWSFIHLDTFKSNKTLREKGKAKELGFSLGKPCAILIGRSKGKTINGRYVQIHHMGSFQLNRKYPFSLSDFLSRSLAWLISIYTIENRRSHSFLLICFLRPFLSRWFVVLGV